MGCSGVCYCDLRSASFVDPPRRGLVWSLQYPRSKHRLSGQSLRFHVGMVSLRRSPQRNALLAIRSCSYRRRKAEQFAIGHISPLCVGCEKKLIAAGMSEPALSGFLLPWCLLRCKGRAVIRRLSSWPLIACCPRADKVAAISALGHKLTSGRNSATTALHPEAGTLGFRVDVC